MKRQLLNRRTVLAGAAGLTVAGVASQWPRLSHSAGYEPLMRLSDRIGMHAQRALIPDRPLAPLYSPDQRTVHYPSNGGYGAPGFDHSPRFEQMLATQFADWRLSIEGLVDRPTRLSLANIRSMPRQSQITMHSCDMGWSAIAEWTGVPLGWLLRHAGVQRAARYVVFLCLDSFQGTPFYGSIDLLDAFHPQTLLAWAINGEPLPRQYGAPLRLRVETQIGYKHTKHIERMLLVDSLKGFGKGFGGLWEDYGYQWYAGM